eukprot:1869055-Amphidinium_carterae.1
MTYVIIYAGTVACRRLLSLPFHVREQQADYTRFPLRIVAGSVRLFVTNVQCPDLRVPETPET